MKKETVLASFPARIATNDVVRFGLLCTTAISLAAATVIVLLVAVAPADAKSVAQGFGFAVAGFGVYALHNRLAANSVLNEKNRLEFSQSLRYTVRRKITANLSLEDASTIMLGGTVFINGGHLWIERKNGEALLMTDKPMGVRDYWTVENANRQLSYVTG